MNYIENEHLFQDKFRQVELYYYFPPRYFKMEAAVIAEGGRGNKGGLDEWLFSEFKTKSASNDLPPPPLLLAAPSTMIFMVWPLVILMLLLLLLDDDLLEGDFSSLPELVPSDCESDESALKIQTYESKN